MSYGSDFEVKYATWLCLSGFSIPNSYPICNSLFTNVLQSVIIWKQNVLIIILAYLLKAYYLNGTWNIIELWTQKVNVRVKVNWESQQDINTYINCSDWVTLAKESELCNRVSWNNLLRRPAEIVCTVELQEDTMKPKLFQSDILIVMPCFRLEAYLQKNISNDKKIGGSGYASCHLEFEHFSLQWISSTPFGIPFRLPVQF